MSWLEKLLPPKIQQTDPSERRTVPEGLWIKCPSCETVLYKTDLEQNVYVCPKCSHHHRIGARARLDTFLDPEGRYEIGQEMLPVGVGFGIRDGASARAVADVSDAVVIGTALVQALETRSRDNVAFAAGDFIATIRAALDSNRA